MTPEQSSYLQKIYRMQEDLTRASTDYWRKYSNMGTWQFWVSLAMLILPLVILYFLLDRKKAFRIGFFGLNVHVWFTHIDNIGIRLALWSYPHHAIPLTPTSFGLDAALVPVVYMLVYQWTINHDKNPYIYLTGLSVVFAFLFKPLLSAAGLFDLNRGMNYFYLFLGYMVIMLLSLWITKFFLYLQKEQGTPPKGELSLWKTIGNKEKAK